MVTPAELLACCTVSYSHPLVAWLIGDSLHPGGLGLTARLASTMGVKRGTRVLDAGSGRGATAVHLAKTIGCDVTGVTVERRGVESGHNLALGTGVEDRVTFIEDDFVTAPLAPESFDFAFIECVLSIVDDKERAIGRLKDLLRPGGRLGISDLTVDGYLPPELHGLLATVGCVGGALSSTGYVDLLEGSGLAVDHEEACDGEVRSLLERISSRLTAAELAIAVGKLGVDRQIIDQGQELLRSVEKQVDDGVLGYTMLVASRPA